MQLENFEQLVQGIDEAQMILIGLGEEWILTEDMMIEDLSDKNTVLQKMLQVARITDGFQMILPVLTAYYYEMYMPDKIEKAYRNMLEMLEGKNYFIVSLTIDPYLEKIGFKEERYVNPCGTYKKLQCENGCHCDLVSSAELIEEMETMLSGIKDMDCDNENVSKLLEQCVEIMERYRCEHCNAPMSFNLLDSKKYCEEGYLPQWQKYMKWLQGTLNRDICVVEAGVGVKQPSVIRWPFEKTVFYNRKAKMFRIHKTFYQVNEEVAERAYGCKCHSVDLFRERNVEA